MAVTYKNEEILSASLLEHMEIHRLVTQRARKKWKKPLTLETVAEGATSCDIALSSPLQRRKIFDSSLK